MQIQDKFIYNSVRQYAVTPMNTVLKSANLLVVTYS